MKAVMDEDMMAVMSQKLEPKLRDDKNRRMKVVCIRMYPNSTSMMSRESAFCEGIRPMGGRLA